MLHTTFDFQLPLGYIDADGQVHRSGVMRLATAHDEVHSLEDPRVRRNDAYLGVLLLARVITRLGTLTGIGTHVIENLFAADYTYLQNVYLELNGLGEDTIETECPNCRLRFTLDMRSTMRDLQP